jgi:hypothetical protein
MTDPNSPDSEPTPEASSRETSPGLSPAAWTGISAIAVALIGGLVTMATTLIPLGQKPASTPPDKTVVPTADALAGRWAGMAHTADGQTYTIALSIRTACQVGQTCGTISVLEVPCHGELSLYGRADDNYEFNVGHFDSSSSATCTPGAGEHFHKLPDGGLSYRADWGIEGILSTVP